MSIVSTAVVRAMLKQATYASLAKERNYTPKKPAKPEVKKEETGLYKWKAERKEPTENELIRWGKNVANYRGYLPITENRLLDYHNTISGTGHGRQYWEEKHNPYES